MKVKELIEELKKFNEDREVMFADLEEINAVSEIELKCGKVVILSDIEEESEEE